MIIDSHQHFWKLSRGDYHWLTSELAPLYRDYGPADLEPILKSNGVVGTVLVQAAATEAESDYMMELAAEHSFILGVVGWVEMSAPDSSERIKGLLSRSHGKLKAIRPMIQEIEDPNWILSPDLDHAFQTLADLGLCFEALVFPKHLPNLNKRIAKHPGLRVVIDHGAKPEIASGEIQSWADDMAQIASKPNTYCKMSGLVTEADEDWQVDDLAPFVITILRLFGPERVMWGSDWPVLSLASDYSTWLRTAESFCEQFSTAERDRIFSGTAVSTYGLEVAHA